MEFQVLGAVGVRDDGHSVSFSSRRQEQLLALLICRAGRAVTAETLIDELWRERAGPAAGKNLQVLVHRLRKTLGDPGRIRLDRSGYMLCARTPEVDAWYFADLAEQGRAALLRDDAHTAATLLGRALALWHGPPFAGLTEVAALAESAAHLEQERRRALTARIDADLALGLHARIVPDLVTLLAEDPLDEATAARLMKALYRSGQRREAVEVYRRTRAALVDELGVEPGPQLRGLEQAMLRGDSDGGPPRRDAETPCLLPPAVHDLTGRDEELRRLTGATREVRTGTPVLCVVSGMPGVGKTALAVRAAHDRRADFPDGQLYINLRGAGPAPVEPHDALARFLRALGVSGTAIPETVDERAEVYRARMSGRRVLVVLDDAAGEGQVEPLIPAGAGCAIVITSRAPLTALPAAFRLPLGVLGEDDAISLLSAVTGRPLLNTDGTVHRLAALCGRLPLALRIAGARLAARPHWSADRLVERLAIEHRRLDELTHGPLSVRASLALGYSGLGEPGRTLLRRLGLLETPIFAGWTAAALLGTGAGDAEDALEGLLDAQLVEYAGTDGIGEARFRLHDLVRLHAKERLAEDEPPGEADAAVIRLIGCYLALAEDAHRRQYGGDYTVLHGHAPRWDPDEATRARLLAEPAAWLRSERLGLIAAVDQAARLNLSETCWDLALTAVTLFEAQGHFDDWERTSQTALAVAMHAGDARGEAAMRYSLGSLDVFRQRYTAAQPHFDTALRLFELVGDRHGQALTLRNAALIHRMCGRAEAALRQYERALTMLREAGDRHAEAHVQGSIAQIHIEHGRAATAASLLDRALAAYRSLGDQRGAAQILNRMGAMHLSEGRPAEAEAAYREVTAAARAGGDLIGEAHGLLGSGEARLMAADHDGAGRLLASALALATEVGEPYVAARTRLAAGTLAAGQGDEERARELLSAAAGDFAELGMPVWRSRAAAALRALGEVQAFPH
ncbi:SARP family transcriptional regulator [Microtetraspora sp. NBRC 13810]|uniref:AfsR/SARP family transcriptional regulator n=1 Tax=Microtetraspora sp. NBRC 13810 TaxID=3030990 RepID=UPI0024A35886|nr:BTAD domain-containing putative transcriptional regulator [Microtetraspora sp. NBRC 13810]GLW11297.1 SARP family transcriptional regulator [Microtetraspora sp. NBRC 13810]